MASFRVGRGAESWEITDGSISYRVSTLGLGMGNVRRLRGRGPLQQGISNRGFRMEEKRLDFIFIFQTETMAEAALRRDLITEIFKPTDDIPLQMIYTRDDGQVRQINGHVDGAIDYADTPESDRIGASQKYTVPFLAMDGEPVWFNPEQKHLTFSTVTTNGFAIPRMIPYLGVTATDISALQSVAYGGDWRTFPVIRVNGPLQGLTITNETTGDLLDFPTLELDAGEVLTIDLSTEIKEASTNLQGDVYPLLSEDSDIVSWHIAANPVAPGGNNDIRVAIPAGATTATSVEINYFDMYMNG